MTKKSKTDSNTETVATPTLLRDIRGASEFVQGIILTVVLALGGMAAFTAIRDAVVKKGKDTATKVEQVK